MHPVLLLANHRTLTNTLTFVGHRKEGMDSNELTQSFLFHVKFCGFLILLPEFSLSLFKSVSQIDKNYSEYGMPLILSRCKQLMETEDISNTTDTPGKNKRAGFKLSAVLDKTSDACTFHFFP